MLTQKKTLYAFEAEAFEEQDNLSLCLEEPVLDAENPVFRPGAAGEPDDAKVCYPASVDRWQDGYGMWYQGEDRAGRLSRCFASSADGFTWQRHGKVNAESLLHTMGPAFNVYNDGDRFLAPLTLADDPPVDAVYPPLTLEQISGQHRRKAAEQMMNRSGRSGVKTFVGVATSDDGVQWNLPEPVDRIPMFLESPWLCRFQGRYLMNAQTHGVWLDPPMPGLYRVVAFFASDDLRQWEVLPQHMKNVAHEAIGGMTHVGIVPVKCIDDRLLIGLGGRFDDGPELPDQHFEVILLYSTNGIDWQPVVPELERRSWIRRGRRGEWDFGGTSAMGLVEHGDQAAAYYAATTLGNCAHACPSYDPGPCQVGRVRFVRDRFAALQPTVGWNAIFQPPQAAGAQGSATTRPVRLSADRPLTLNADIPSDCGAAITVDLLSPRGEAVDTARVTEGGVRAAVPLAGGTPDEPVRLRLTLTGGAAPDRVPRLFAIEC